jgi:RNA recognition motif-containing protein
VSRPNSESSATSPTVRGPPRKPKQSGFALWCGNLPAQTNIVDLKDHFSRDATNEIESVFLIAKSNCAFINYKTEESCTSALTRFHESRFQGAKLVCRLRRGCTVPPSGTPTGPRASLGSCMPSQSSGTTHERPAQGNTQEDIEQSPTTATREKFFVMKSLTVEDLDMSVRSGSWATQSQNEAALNTAYKVNLPKNG